MMINQIDPITAQKIDAPQAGSYFQKDEFSAPPNGLALHQVFSEDVMIPHDLSLGSTDLRCLSNQNEPHSSWIKRILSWLLGRQTENLSSVSRLSETDVSKAIPPTTSRNKPIDRTPELDPPASIPESMISTGHPKKALMSGSLSENQIAGFLSRMSDQTIESILMILLKVQFELEKENALVAEGTLSRYQKYLKLQEKLFEEIKDVLAKDQNIAGWLKTLQDWASAAYFICGVAAASVLAGRHLNVTAIFPSIFNGLDQLSQIGPVFTSLFLGLTGGGKTYFANRVKEDLQVHEEYSYRDKYLNERTNWLDKISNSIAENDDTYKRKMIELFRRFSEMARIIQARS